MNTSTFWIISFLLTFMLVLSQAEAVNNPFDNLDQRLKSNAVAKWPDDYNMQVFEVTRQLEAAQKLIAFMDYVNGLQKFPVGSVEKTSADIVARIIVNAVEKWDDDFTMVWFEIGKQLEAFNQLNQ